MTFAELQKEENSLQQLPLLLMSGAGARIFCGSIRLFILDCGCKKWELIIYTRTSPEWQHAPLFGSTNFFKSLLVLLPTPTTFSRHEISRSGSINLSMPPV